VPFDVEAPETRSSHGSQRKLLNECFGEVVGTFILLFFGLGVNQAAIFTGAGLGLGDVAGVWGVSVALAIYTTSAISGAHINPAITIAFAAFRGFPKKKVVPYIFSQTIGAFLAAATIYLVFHSVIAAFEQAHGIVRGAPNSELSASAYGEYFPNPSMVATSPGLTAVTMSTAMCAEIIATAMLTFIVFALNDDKNAGRPATYFTPLLIGCTVAALIAIVSPITQACFNPARDFGPRLFAYLAGWGHIAIPGPRGGVFNVYILSPILGALLGAAIYEKLLRRCFDQR